MLYNSKISRQYAKLKHDIGDVYLIIRELDEKTNLRGRDCDIVIDKYLDSLGSFASWGKKYLINNYEEEQQQFLKERLGDIRGIRIVEQQDHTWTFYFREEVLEWDYEMLRELVIHEYAHYVENVTTPYFDIDYDYHGESFVNIVNELGGSFVSTHMEDDTDAFERMTIESWKLDYKRKVNPNLLTLHLCHNGEITKTIQLGYPYNNRKYKEVKQVFNQYSLGGYKKSLEDLLNSTDVELMVSQDDFRNKEELYHIYHSNARYWIMK